MTLSDEHVIRIVEQLGRMEGKLDHALPALTDHEDRLRKLEKYRWTQLGGAAAISFLITFLPKLGVFPT